MPIVVNVDGRLVPPGEARVSVFDHGFLYGDSVYETLRTYGGKVWLLPEHLERLERSASLVGLALPLTLEGLAAEVERTVSEAAEPEAAIRVVVTRGEGAIGIDPRLSPRPGLVVIARPLAPLAALVYEEGVHAIVARTARNSPRALDPEIKSGNFLNNIQAVREAIAAGAFEALMLNVEGNLAEGTQSNVFLVRDGRLETPPGSAGILRGITREVVLRLARSAGIPAEERDVFAAALWDADEIFLTSTLKEIVPVVRLGRHPVGAGRPGPVTLALLALYREEVRRVTG